MKIYKHMKTAFRHADEKEKTTGHVHDVVVRPDGFAVIDRNPPLDTMNQLSIFGCPSEPGNLIKSLRGEI